MGPDIYKYSRLFSFPDISKWARQQLFHTINPGARTASRGAGRSPPGPRLGVGRGGAGGAPAPVRQVPAEPQAPQGAGPPAHTPSRPSALHGGGPQRPRGRRKTQDQPCCLAHTGCSETRLSAHTSRIIFMIPGNNAADIAEFVCFLSFS